VAERHDKPRRGHAIISVRYRTGMSHRYECRCGVLLGMTLRESRDIQRFHRLDLWMAEQTEGGAR